jgi:hypothetical protein
MFTALPIFWLDRNTEQSITSCCHWALGVSGLFPAGSCVPHEPHTAHSLQCHRPLGTRRSPTQYIWYLNQTALSLRWHKRSSWWWRFKWSFGLCYHEALVPPKQQQQLVRPQSTKYFKLYLYHSICLYLKLIHFSLLLYYIANFQVKEFSGQIKNHYFL